MKAGLYALASLDGAPLSDRDIETMGLTGGQESLRVHTAGFAARCYDVQTAATGVMRTADVVFLFAGFLDEAEELAGTLGLAASTPPVELAAAALGRFGKEAPAAMLGEWCLLRWDVRARELTLVASEALRDPMYFAAADGLLAVSPDPLQLTRLPWVGFELDPLGFALSLSRAGLRQIRSGETFWRGVQGVLPGASETFRPRGRVSEKVSAATGHERWDGSFEEAAEALESLGRRIVRQHMERHGCTAFHLSGGLDSTLLSSWGAYERGPGRQMFCISSVAPPGSRLPDESRFIRAAAATLNVPVREIWPAEDGELFRIAPERFEEAAGLVAGPYLVHEALGRAAVEGGASAMISGVYGEMHLTAGFEEPETRSWLRIRAARLRDDFVRSRNQGGWPGAAFHVRLSQEMLQQLPRNWAGVWRKGPPRTDVWAKGDPPIGISPMLRKAANQETAVAGGLRELLPFRDQRLMRLAARMPLSFLSHEGTTRPFARRLLRGRVPDVVRLREQGRPFSPDFVPRLKRQAGAAQARIDVFQAAGVHRWIDLAWLPAALTRLQEHAAERDYKLFYEVNGTVAAAEFLVWAAARGAKL